MSKRSSRIAKRDEFQNAITAIGARLKKNPPAPPVREAETTKDSELAEGKTQATPPSASH